MNKRERAALTISLLLLDALAIGLALILAFYLRIASGLLPYTSPYQFADYIRMIGLAVPVFLAIFAYAGLYDPHLLLGGPQEYARVVSSCTFGVVALIVLSFWERGDLLSRGWLLLAWVLSALLAGSARFIFRRVIFYLRRWGLFVSRTLVVGANEQAKAIVRQLSGSKGRGVQVIGFLDDYLPPGTPVMDGLEVLGSPSELERLSKETGAGGVVIVPDALAWESFQDIIRKAASRLNGLEVKLSPGFYEILTTGVKVDQSTFVPLLTVERVRITGLDALLKNLLDYGLGLVILLLTGPLMAVISLVLWMKEGMPILDRHLVLGLGGRAFYTLKFRTGLLGETRRSLVHPVPSKLANPDHYSGLGSFLYRTGLDKLPQIFNVLQGKMSLVGPRTISVGGSDQFGPWLSSMLTVKPGMTGPWAVRSVAALHDEIRLTVYYIRNWTIWSDLQILVGTARRVLRWAGIRRLEERTELTVDPIQETSSSRSSVLDTMRGE
jgi:lipopolysaccharide/colanic/teichoic acid biosynthesis glycosyltransferase